MNATHLQAVGERAFAILTEHHVGQCNGITARELARACGSDERSVRKAVEIARRSGAAICAHPAHGYFMPASATELAATVAFLRSRALTSLMQVSQLTKQPLAEICGQLPLDLPQEQP